MLLNIAIQATLTSQQVKQHMLKTPKVQKNTIHLSAAFFKRVFTDAFIFSAYKGPTAQQLLDDAQLNDEQQKLAWRIHKSQLYSQDTQEYCADLCDQLASIFQWQSNSEGPLIFASKIWYLLLAKNKDVAWFKERMLG